MEELVSPPPHRHMPETLSRVIDILEMFSACIKSSEAALANRSGVVSEASAKCCDARKL
jgi:hypothetical protein